MDSNVSTLRTAVAITGYRSGTQTNIGECPEGLKVDSVNAHTDLNQRIPEKNILARMAGKSIIVSVDLPRKDTATMRVTVSVAFVPEVKKKECEFSVIRNSTGNYNVTGTGSFIPNPG